jgi:hypothetical protein
MDTRSTPNNKIRKARIRIVVYVLMLMMLRAKTKTCTLVKYKRSRVDAIKGVVKDKLGFISIDLNHQGYKLESFVLAKHVAQVFYIPDTTKKRLKVVIPRK